MEGEWLVMRISFDVDDTLMLHGEGVPCDPNQIPVLLRFIFKERLRKGSIELLHTLRDQGHELCVYTTSSRKISYMKWWFKFYRVNLKLIVNSEIHSLVVKSTKQFRAPSKNPAKFGIDMHIDDLEGVREEGELHGFKTLIIDPEDLDWVDKVLREVENEKTI